MYVRCWVLVANVRRISRGITSGLRVFVYVKWAVGWNLVHYPQGLGFYPVSSLENVDRRAADYIRQWLLRFRSDYRNEMRKVLTRAVQRIVHIPSIFSDRYYICEIYFLCLWTRVEIVVYVKETIWWNYSSWYADIKDFQWLCNLVKFIFWDILTVCILGKP